MILKRCIFLLTALCLSLHAATAPELLQAVKPQAEERWNRFAKENEFKTFVPGRSDQELHDEFEGLHSHRELLWTTSDFERADYLVDNDLIRAPGCVAFSYNNTEQTYNASTIWIGNKCYIACEGPRSKDIPSFFRLLSTYGVTHLVRLTDSYEGETKKCHPYWDGLLKESAGQQHLHLPTGETVRAYDIAHWRDNQGVDPHELLALVLQVREHIASDDALLLVHCSAGVGRTGTFLAALAIVDAIDQGESFSIEEIVYRLSLQRIHSVGKFSQYITLHRLAEIYLNEAS